MITIDKGIVARWKIDTRFENWLSFRADHSRIFKRLYVAFYAIFDRAYYRKGKEMASKTMADFHAEKLCEGGLTEKKILFDMLYSLHRFGFSYEEYFLYELFNKNTKGREEFISEKMRYEYCEQLNSQEGIALLRDKGRTYELLGDFYKRDCVTIYEEGDFPEFQKFVKKHFVFLYKPIDRGWGKGIKKIDSTNYEEKQLFLDLYKNGAYIVEELIEQADILAEFHRQSVNTVRIATVTCLDGVHVIASFFRMGRGDALVDNGGAGGIFASVDPESGIIISKATSEFWNENYIFHPDTKKKIVGFQLPDWENALQLIKSMVTLLPNIKYIGWDLAYTEERWVLVEANGCGQFLTQVADKVGLKYKFLELMRNGEHPK